MKKIASITLYVLLAISVLSIVGVFTLGDLGLDLILIWAAILLGLSIVITLGMAAVNLGKNPKGAVRSLIGLGVIAVVLLISYFLSSAEPIITPVAVYDKAFDLIVTDMGLYTAYAAMVISILVVVVGEIRNSFK